MGNGQEYASSLSAAVAPSPVRVRCSLVDILWCSRRPVHADTALVTAFACYCCNLSACRWLHLQQWMARCRTSASITVYQSQAPVQSTAAVSADERLWPARVVVRNAAKLFAC